MHSSAKASNDFQAVKHLAQVFLDGELNGTPLEGESLSTTVPHIQEFLTWLSRSGHKDKDLLIKTLAMKSFTADTQKALEGLMAKMQKLAAVEEKMLGQTRHLKGRITGLRTAGMVIDQELMPFLKTLGSEILENFEKDKDVYFPGGWSGKPGHQMIYRLVYDEKTGRVNFLVYNTGGGIQYHGSEPRASGKPGYYPIYGVSLPAAAFANKDKMSNWLSQLLKFQAAPLLDPKLTYNAAELYENFLLPSCAWLEGKKIPGEELAKLILGQRSGTCVFKALTWLMRPHFADKTAYRQFFFAYRLFRLDRAIAKNEIQKIEAIVPDYRKLLKGCLENTVRMLDVDLKPYITEWALEKEDTNALLECFEAWQAEVTGLVSGKTSNARVLTKDSRAEKLATDTIMLAIPVFNGQDLAEVKDDWQVFEPETANNFYEALKKLTDLEVSEGRFVALVERFCSYFVTEGAARCTIDPAKANDFLSAIEKLFTRYKECRPEMTARSLPIYLSLMFLMDKVCENGGLPLDSVSREKLFIAPLYAAAMVPFIKEAMSNPFTTTEDADLDNLYQSLRDYYTEQFRLGEMMGHSGQHLMNLAQKYYFNLINSAPEAERTLIKERWETVDSQNKDLVKRLQGLYPLDQIYCYSYLNKDNADLLQKTPILKAAFEKQVKLETFLCKCLGQIALYCEPSPGRDKLPGHEKKPFHFNNTINMSFKDGNLSSILILFFSIAHNTHSSKSSKDQDRVLLLKPVAINQRPQITHQGLKNTLLSHYDANPYNSMELAFNDQRASYLPEHFVSAATRQRVEASCPALVSRSDEARLESKLQNLRLSPRCQVVLHLSELLHEPTWLASDDFQNYLQMTLFQSEALLEALTQSADLWPLLERLLKQNRFNEDPSYPEKAEWFVLKLATGLSGYALDQAKKILPNGEILKTFQSWQDRMEQAATLRLKNPKQTMAEERENHRCRLSVLLRSSNRNLELILESYLALVLLPLAEKTSSVYEEESLQALLSKVAEGCLAAEWKRAAGTSNLLLCKILKELLKRRQISTDSLNLVVMASTFPKFVLTSSHDKIVVDISTGSIVRNGKTSSYLPMSVRLAPEYRELFGSQAFEAQETCDRYFDGGAGDGYTWEHNSQKYRVLQVQKTGKKFFQKLIQGTWYTLSAPTQAIARQWGFSHHAFTDALPPLFEQAAYRVWVGSPLAFYVIEDRASQQPCYEKRMGGVAKYEKDGLSPNRLNLDKHSVPDFLSRLENKLLIESLEVGGGVFHWHLPRYGLTIIPGDQAKTYQTADRQYWVELPDGNDDLGSGLVLRAKRDLNEVNYLLPLQPFYELHDAEEEPQAAGAHYAWVHDLSNFLANESLNEEGMSDKDKKTKKEDIKRLGWDYRGSERLLRYSLQEGELQASSAADQVYLAYLNLAQDRPEKALELLKTCEFQGNVEEMERLWWILTKLPENSKKPFVNSRIVAVQAYALHAMVNLKQQFPASQHFKMPEGPVTSDTQQVRLKERGKLQKFVSEIHKEVERFYSVYDNRRNNIPEELRLAEAQELYLLSYTTAEKKRALLSASQASPSSQQDVQTAYTGVMGTRYLENFHGNNDIEEEKAVSFYPSLHLIKQAVVLSPDLKMISAKTFGQMKPESEQPSDYKEAMKVLSPWMAVEDLMKHFPAYYAIALETVDPDKLKLKADLALFAKAAAYYEKGKDEASVALILAAKILWTALHPPHNFSQNLASLVRVWNSHDIFNSLLNTCSTSRTPNLTIEVSETQFKPHTVLPKLAPQAMPKVLLPALEVKEENKDPIAAIPELDELLKALEKQEALYQEEARKILSELKEGLSELSLSEQTALFSMLDTQLLEHYKKRLSNQVESYQNFKKNLIDPDKFLPALEEAKTQVVNEKRLAREIIEAILENRKVPVIAELGRQREVPSVDSLIKNYAKASQETYLNMGIAPVELPALEEALKNYFSTNNAEFRLSSLIKAVATDQKQASLETEEKVVNALVAKDGATRKEEAVLQYIQNISLYPEQVRMLTMLVENECLEEAASYVMQMIMGGGKTKVLLPLLLYLLANGKNLAIAMFPDMLLKTSFSDLHATSTSVFQQEGFLFHFDREAPCDPASLRHIYERFELAIKHKQYIATTDVSMKSLQLKCVELLFARAHPNPNKPLQEKEKEISEQQIAWLSKILLLLEENGILAADEGHLLFYIRRALNYAIGQSKAIDYDLVDTVVSLYSWMAAEPVSLSGKQGLYLLRQLIEDPKLISDDTVIAKLMEAYVEALVKAPPTWAKNLLVEPLGTKHLHAFLLDKMSAAEEVQLYKVLDSCPLIKARWILLREEFSSLLQHTLREKLHEHYGPASVENEETSLKEVNNPCAVPFSALNTPTPFVFADFMKAINCTAQMLYCDGLSLRLLKNTLRSWQEEARLERAAEPGAMTTIERLFNHIFKDAKAFENQKLSLLDMDLDNAAQLKKLHEEYRTHPTLVKEVLKDSLSRMRIDLTILGSDSVNLASMFKRVYAFSATPDNYRTYNPKVQLRPETSLLIRSRFKDYLKKKNTEIREVAADTVDEFLEFCVTVDPNVRALIDCGARLRGRDLNNLEVAKKLARLCKKYHPKLRYVLFFHEDALCAWKIDGPDTQIPKKLTSTKAKVIAQELADENGNPLKPDERFTLYDQHHSLGIDIKQDKEAVAVLTADDDTHMSKFAQAGGRMRGLSKKQRLAIAVPPGLMSKASAKAQEKAALSVKKSDSEVLCDYFEKNEEQALEEDHFPAALKNIANVFREDLLRRCFKERRPKYRDELFKKSLQFFIEAQSDDVVALYQQKKEPMRTDTILKNSIERQLAEWQEIMKDEGLAPETLEATTKSLNKRLQDLRQQAVKICREMQITQAQQLDRQAQQQRLQEKHRHKYNELRASPLKVRDLSLDWIRGFLFREKFDKGQHQQIFPLMNRHQQAWAYDDNLYASNSYLYNLQGQEKEDIYNLYTKTNTALLFALDKKEGDKEANFTAILVGPEEAELLSKEIRETHSWSKKYNAWLVTPNGESFGSKPPLSPQQQKKVNALLEQAAFLSGRLDILSSRVPTPWLLTAVDQKLKFLQEQVVPPLGISGTHFKRLQDRLLKLDSYVELWARYPLDSGILENSMKTAPQEVKKRLERLLPFLSAVRNSNLPAAAPLDVEQLELPLQDALLVAEYQTTLKLLSLFRIGRIQEAVQTFANIHDKLPLGFLDYCLGGETITLSKEQGFEIISSILKMNNEDLMVSWVKQVFAANSLVAPLPYKELDLYLSKNPIRDYDRCVSFIRKMILLNASLLADEKEVGELFSLLGNIERQFKQPYDTNDKLLHGLHIFSSMKIRDVAIIKQFLLDPDFVALVYLLLENRLPLQAELLKNWAMQGNNKMNKVKDRLTLLIQNQFVEHDYLKVLCDDSAWALLSVFIATKMNNKDFIIHALKDSDLQLVIPYLHSYQLFGLETLPLFMSSATICTALKVLMRSNIHNKDLVNQALRDSSFQELLASTTSLTALPLSAAFLNTVARLNQGEQETFRRRISYLVKRRVVPIADPEILFHKAAWETVAAFQEAKADDEAHVRLALTDARIQVMTLMLTRQGLSGEKLPLDFLNTAEAKRPMAKKLLEYLDYLTLVQADSIEALGHENAWQALEALATAAVFPNKLLVASILKDPHLQTLIHYFNQHKLVKIEHLKALEQPKILLTAQLLKEAKIEKSVLIERALKAPVLQNLLLWLADNQVRPDSLPGWFLDLPDEKLIIAQKLLTYLTINEQPLLESISALQHERIWQSIAVMEQAAVQDVALIKKTLTEAGFQTLLLWFDLHGFRGESLPQDFVNKYHKQSATALQYLEYINAYDRLLNIDNLQALCHDVTWQALGSMIDARIDDSNLLFAALRDPAFQELLRELTAAGLRGLDLTAVFLTKCRGQLPIVKRLLAYLRGLDLTQLPNLRALRQEQTWAALLVLEEAGVADPVLANRALNDANFQALLLWLAAHNYGKENLPLNFLLARGAQARKANDLLAYLDRLGLATLNNIGALSQDGVWDAILLLEEAGVNDPALSVAALTNSDFRHLLLWLGQQGFRRQDLPLDFLRARYQQADRADELIAYLARHHLASLNNIKALSEDVAWEALGILNDAGPQADGWINRALVLINEVFLDAELAKAIVVLKGCELNNAFLFDELRRDQAFKASIAAHYQQDGNHLRAWTMRAIKAVDKVRDGYSRKRFYAPHLASINTYTKESIGIFLANDQEANRAVAERQIVKDISEAGYRNFQHRDFALRMIVDVLLALTVVGLLVHATRKLTGNSFFFSTATTERQDSFEKETAPLITCRA